MELLVIVAIILLFSVLDGVARKQRQAQHTGGEGTATTDPPRTRPTSDEPRSFDRETEDEVPPRSMGPTSSEELLPTDLWEEIRRLAQGKAAPTQRPVPAPRPRRPRPAQGQGARRPPPEPTSPPAPAEHPVHLTHGKMGRPMAERRTPPARPGQGRQPSADVQAVREMLSADGAPALRRAVILVEVLGPPAALRGDPYVPGG